MCTGMYTVKEVFIQVTLVRIITKCLLRTCDLVIYYVSSMLGVEKASSVVSWGYGDNLFDHS